MFPSLVQFSTLAGGLFEEGHPPAELMTIHLGLTPLGVVAVVLLAMGLAWVAMKAQAGRTDLHAAAGHGSHHDGGHHDADHHHSGGH